MMVQVIQMAHAISAASTVVMTRKVFLRIVIA